MNHRSSIVQLTLCLLVIATFSLITTTPTTAALLDADQLRIGGRATVQTSVQMEDFIQTTSDEEGSLSMWRNTLKVEGNLDLGDWGSMTAILRGQQEVEVGVLQDLQNGNLVPSNTATFTGGLAPNAAAADLTDVYESEGSDVVRELYWEGNLTQNIYLQLGRQLVSWGKTDFFQSLDVIHGFDNTWHTFLAPDQERRKPLWMANLQIDMEYEITEGLELSQLQLLWAPGGINEGEDLGNINDIFGGRWAGQPYAGIDFIDPRLNMFNFDHPASDADKGQYGARIYGTAFNRLMEWSLGYWHGFNQGAIFLPRQQIPCTAGYCPISIPGQNNPVTGSFQPTMNIKNPYSQGPSKGGLTDIIHPEIDVIGTALNYYVSSIDVVTRLEMAYTIDKPFNIGSAENSNFGAQPMNSMECAGDFAGFCGVIEKDELNMALNFDKEMMWTTEYLKTNSAGFLTVQVFDSWLPNFEKSDDIVSNAGFGAARKEHEAIATAVLNLSYFNSTVNPSFATGTQLTHGGWFYIPGVSFVYGNNWRATIQAEIFAGSDSVDVPNQFAAQRTAGSNTHFFDIFDNRDAIFTEVTYQF